MHQDNARRLRQRFSARRERRVCHDDGDMSAVVRLGGMRLLNGAIADRPAVLLALNDGTPAILLRKDVGALVARLSGRARRPTLAAQRLRAKQFKFFRAQIVAISDSADPPALLTLRRLVYMRSRITKALQQRRLLGRVKGRFDDLVQEHGDFLIPGRSFNAAILVLRHKLCALACER